MAKTSKPLFIAITQTLVDEPWVQVLRDKGHTIEPFISSADLILAPQACRWLPGMEEHLDALIKGARAVKFPLKLKMEPLLSATGKSPGSV